MFSETRIPAETVTAYLATEYRVLGSHPFTLKAKQASPELRALYQQEQVQSAAFLTAWNPYSETQTHTDNHAAQMRLLAELSQRQLPVLPGLGCDPLGEWEAEESILILGIGLDDAKTLGNQFKQNALTWAGADATPQLILLR